MWQIKTPRISVELSKILKKLRYFSTIPIHLIADDVITLLQFATDKQTFYAFVTASETYYNKYKISNKIL